MCAHMGKGAGAPMQKSENNAFVESVPPSHFHLGSREQNQVLRRSRDSSSPAESPLLVTGSCSLQTGCY